MTTSNPDNTIKKPHELGTEDYTYTLDEEQQDELEVAQLNKARRDAVKRSGRKDLG